MAATDIIQQHSIILSNYLRPYIDEEATRLKAQDAFDKNKFDTLNDVILSLLEHGYVMLKEDGFVEGFSNLDKCLVYTANGRIEVENRLGVRLVAFAADRPRPIWERHPLEGREVLLQQIRNCFENPSNVLTFLYGPQGSGKSKIARVIKQCYPETVLLIDCMGVEYGYDLKKKILLQLNEMVAINNIDSLFESVMYDIYDRDIEKSFILENVHQETLREKSFIDLILLLSLTVGAILITVTCESGTDHIVIECESIEANRVKQHLFLDELASEDCKRIVRQYVTYVDIPDEIDLSSMAQCPLLLHQFGGLYCDFTLRNRLLDFVKSQAGTKSLNSKMSANVVSELFDMIPFSSLKECLVKLQWFATKFTVEAACAVLELEQQQTLFLLTLLHHHHFLEMIKTGGQTVYFEMHSLVKMVVRNKSQSSASYTSISNKAKKQFQEFYIRSFKEMVGKIDTDFIAVYRKFTVEETNFVVAEELSLSDEDFPIAMSQLIKEMGVIFEVAFDLNRRLGFIQKWLNLALLKHQWLYASYFCIMTAPIIGKLEGTEMAMTTLSTAESYLRDVKDSDEKSLCNAFFKYCKGQVMSKLPGNDSLNTALQYLLESLTERERLLKEHSDVVRSYNEIGITYYKLNNFKMAAQYFDKSCSLRKRLTRSENHPDYLIALENLASVVKEYITLEAGHDYCDSFESFYFQMGKYRQLILLQESQWLYMKSISLAEKIYDQKVAISIIRLLRNISNNCLFLKQYWSAIWFGLNGLLAGTKIGDVNTQCLMVSLSYFVSQGYTELGKVDDAVNYLQDALSILMLIPESKRPLLLEKITSKLGEFGVTVDDKERETWTKFSFSTSLDSFLQILVSDTKAYKYLSQICQELKIEPPYWLLRRKRDALKDYFIQKHMKAPNKEAWKSIMRDFVIAWSSRDEVPRQERWRRGSALCGEKVMTSQMKIFHLLKHLNQDFKNLCADAEIEYNGKVLFNDSIHDGIWPYGSNSLTKSNESFDYCYLNKNVSSYTSVELGLTFRYKEITESELSVFVWFFRPPESIRWDLEYFTSIQSELVEISTDFFFGKKFEVWFKLPNNVVRIFKDRWHYVVIKQWRTENITRLNTRVIEEDGLFYAVCDFLSDGIYAVVTEPPPQTFTISHMNQPVELCPDLHPGFQLLISDQKDIGFQGTIQVVEIDPCHVERVKNQVPGVDIGCCFSVAPNTTALFHKPARLTVPVQNTSQSLAVVCESEMILKDITASCNLSYDATLKRLSMDVNHFSSYLVLYLGIGVATGISLAFANRLVQRSSYPRVSIHQSTKDSCSLTIVCAKEVINAVSKDKDFVLLESVISTTPCFVGEEISVDIGNYVKTVIRYSEDEKGTSTTISLTKRIEENVTPVLLRNSNGELMSKFWITWSNGWKAEKTKAMFEENLFGLRKDCMTFQDLDVLGFLREFPQLPYDDELYKREKTEQLKFLMLQLSISILSSSDAKTLCQQICSALLSCGSPESAKELEKVTNGLLLSWKDNWEEDPADWYLPIDFIALSSNESYFDLLLKILNVTFEEHKIEELRMDAYESRYQALKAWYFKNVDVNALDLLRAIYTTGLRDLFVESDIATQFRLELLYEAIINAVSKWLKYKDPILRYIKGTEP